MKLSIPINIEKPDFALNPDSVITGIGSCFAEYVMKQLEGLNCKISYNPCGILYNSYSTRESLEYIVTNREYKDCDFIFHNNLWHSWLHHGTFSSQSKQKMLEKITSRVIDFRDALTKSSAFILTPSSSVVYCLKENNRIVANCHKYPGNKFYTKVLSTEENYQNIFKSIDYIRSINKNCKIIITLSPVRHYPGNLVLNAKSKANLLSAIHLCLDKIWGIYYFPSYEILLDELRDYRFFAEDMLHPSELARKIIFQKFLTAFYSPNDLNYFKTKAKELKKAGHRQLH